MTKKKSKKKNNILDSLNKMKETDVYSLLLYCLYKIGDNSKYSTLSSLMWCLDKESLLNFLTVFGGIELKVPTITELKSIVLALQIYQMVDLEKVCDLEVALDSISAEGISTDTIKDTYFELRDIISKEAH